MVTLNTRTYVPAIGRKDASYIIVAEQPGRQEVEEREPMVGPAGENLNECLRNAGISRNDCYITNVIKDLDHPLDYYIDMRKKKEPIQTPGIAYMDVLRHELSKTNGIIIPMGNVALYALTDRFKITNWRGSVIESTLLPGRKVVPTFHPATYTQEKLFINPKLSLNRVLIIYDLIRAKQQAGTRDIVKTPRKVSYRPTCADALAFLDKCAEHSRIFYDIELFSNEMSCISFAYNEHEAMCIPFVSPEGQFYTVDEEMMIMDKISELLESNIIKTGQNIIFDSHFLHSRYGIRTINMDDTMIAQGLIMPEYPKGLNFITSIWTDINYYKDEGKIWLGGGGDWNNGYIYNGLDSLACAASFNKQVKELEEMGNYHAYERQVALVEPLTYMMEHGVRVDMGGYSQKILGTHLELERKREEINRVIGNINPDSPAQLMNYFYKIKAIEPIRNKKRKVTTDEHALVELAGKGHHEAQLILDWRNLKVLTSRYLDMDKIDPDGRLRCSYNPVGTRYGRISSSKNIYGTGMNMMNLPFDVRTYLIADKGYIIYSLDLSQAENRLVAYIGHIDSMIRVFESGQDLHRLTASLIYGVTYDKVTSEQREWGKRANHGFNYGLGPKHFSTLYQVPFEQARGIHRAYHRAYPGVEHGYWKYVQDELRQNGRTLQTLFGRRIKFYQKYGEQMLNEAYSAIPQGTVGEMINERGIKFIYYHEDPLFKKVEILTQVHDSIDFQIPLSLPLEQHANLILQVVESLEAPLMFHRQPIRIPCDLVINYNLNKKIGIEIKSPSLPRTINELTKLLRESIDELARQGSCESFA